MLCNNCGKELAEGTKFCRYCGCKVDGAGVAQGVAGSGLLQPVLNEQPQQNPAVTDNGLMSSGLVSAVQNNGGAEGAVNDFGAAKQTSANPFGAQQNPFGASNIPVSSNPFEQQNVPSQQNPFGAQPEQVQPNPFGTQPDVPQSNPFSAPAQPEPVNGMDNNNVWNPDMDEKKAKKAKKAKEKKNSKGSGAQTAKIVIMVLLQFVFIGAIAFLAMKGKLINKYGDINLGLVIGAFAGVIVVDVILYLILFAGRNKRSELAPPPVFASHDNKNASPMYMDVSQNSSNVFAMGNVEKTDRDRLLDNEDRYQSANANLFGAQTPEVYSSSQQAVQNSNAEAEGFATTQILDTPVYDSKAYPKLLYTDNGEAKQVEVNKPEFIIGRMQGKVDCVVTNKSVGRIHAAIVTRDGNYYIKDFNSKNKTYINKGTPLAPEQEYLLHDNDIISLADSEIVFKFPE